MSHYDFYPIAQCYYHVLKTHFYPNIIGDFQCMNETQLRGLIAVVRELHTATLTNSTGTEPSDWTYPACIFFASTIITTIGEISQLYFF